MLDRGNTAPKLNPPSVANTYRIYTGEMVLSLLCRASGKCVAIEVQLGNSSGRSMARRRRCTAARDSDTLLELPAGQSGRHAGQERTIQYRADEGNATTPFWGQPEYTAMGHLVLRGAGPGDVLVLTRNFLRRTMPHNRRYAI